MGSPPGVATGMAQDKARAGAAIPQADDSTVDRNEHGQIVAVVDNATWAAWEAERLERARRRPRPVRTQREKVIDAACASSGVFEYLSRDEFATLCWRCGEPLRVTLRHAHEARTARLLGVDLACVGGCFEADLAASLLEGVAA